MREKKSKLDRIIEQEKKRNEKIKKDVSYRKWLISMVDNARRCEKDGK